MRVAMIEDDIELAEILAEYLGSHNIDIVNFDDPYLALAKLRVESFDALILDLTLPQIDGLEILKDLRKFSDIPVIISSARSDIADKVLGLELGADDYLPKPYNPRELEARLKAITRRRGKTAQSDIKIDRQKGVVYFKNRVLDLTPAEFEILSYLYENSPRAVSREELIRNIDSLNENSTPKSVDVIIGRIREKLRERENPKHLLSVRGVGYRLIR